MTQDEDKQNKNTTQKTEGAIKDGQYRVNGNIGYTRHRTKTNKTKPLHRKPKGQSRMDNTESMQRNWQHGVHKTQDEDKPKKPQHNMCWIPQANTHNVNKT